MAKQSFNKRVAYRQQKLGHALCVGLDPDPNHLPAKYEKYSESNQILYWMLDVINDTAPYATVFKPQLAYYLRLGASGYRVLDALIGHLCISHREIPVALDGKFGDIDRTQQRYREFAFTSLNVDAVTVSPYMGREPIVEMHDPTAPERGVISLVYTSNPGGRQVQDVYTIHPKTYLEMPYWRFMAECTIDWAKEAGIQNLGFVMAAAHKKDGAVYSDHLRLCRELDQGTVPYLMPGFGTQGGYVEASVQAGWAGWGSLMMNASSSINNAKNPGAAAKQLAGQIGEAIAKRLVI